MSDARFIAIYGASDGGVALLDAVRAEGQFDVKLFLDDTPEAVGTWLCGLPVIDGRELSSLPARGIEGLATHVIDREFRLALRERAHEAGLTLVNVVHPRAFVSPTARLGAGNVVKAGAVIDAECRVGDCCIIDNGAIVAHHCVIGDGCHLAPGVATGGACQIGERTFISVGSVLSSRISIGRNVIVSPGAVVVADVADDVVLAGNPAKVIGERR